MSAIGILGGMGPQASARLQTLIVQSVPRHIVVKSDADFPEIVLLSVPVPNFIKNKKNMQIAKRILVKRTKTLADAGTVVNGIACNTAHLLLGELRASTTVPFVSIPELVAAKLIGTGAKRVGLLATPTTLKSTLYDDALGSLVAIIRPDAATAIKVEASIYRKLKDTPHTKDQEELRSIVNQFIEEQELDAVILGCTELPLIFGEVADKRVVDTLQVLADGLLSKYVGILAEEKRGKLTQ